MAPNNISYLSIISLNIESPSKLVSLDKPPYNFNKPSKAPEAFSANNSL